MTRSASRAPEPRAGEELSYGGRPPDRATAERLLEVSTDFLRRAAVENPGLGGTDVEAAIAEAEHDWLSLRGELMHVELHRTGELGPAAVIVPGLGDHTRRHTPLAGRLRAAGFNVIGVDRRGHGLSEGPRGDTPLELDFELIELAAAEARRRFGGPVVLIGDSLGGIILWYLLTRQPDAEAVVCHCISHPAVAHEPSMRVKAPLMRGLAMARPRARIPVSRIADYEHVALDPLTKAYFDAGEDPLFNTSVSARATSTYLRFEPARPWHEVEIPALVMIGEDDRMTSPRFVGASLERDRPPNAELLELEDAGHQLFLDHLDRSFDPMIDWIRAALARSAAAL